MEKFLENQVAVITGASRGLPVPWQKKGRL